MSRIRLSSELKTIENGAFTFCYGLKNINYPDCLEQIGTGAFTSCSSLKSVHIPAMVNKIEANPFPGCINLASITVDENNYFYKSEENCIIAKSENLLISGCKSSVIPDYIQNIGKYTFSGMSDITSIAIPSSVRKISDSAFVGCRGLTELVLPQSLEEIGDGAFMKCSGLTELVLPQSLEEIGDWAFMECRGLTELVLPQSLEKIGWGTFENCVGITSLYIPGNLTLKKRAFAGCTGLKRVELAEGVESIGSPIDDTGVFQNCSELESAVLPSTVQYINTYTFFGCEKLTSILVAEDNPVYRSDGNSILNKSGETLMLCTPKSQIPEYVEYIGKKACVGCSSKVLIIPPSVKSIGNGAFAYSSIEYLILPEGLLSISENIFFGNNNVVTVTMPRSLEQMSRHAFNRVSIFTCQSAINPAGWGSDDLSDWYVNLHSGALSCVYGYDGEYPYVQSVKVSFRLMNIKLPYRLGYSFAGLTLTENGDTPDFGIVEDDNGNLSIALSREQLSELHDTVLYAVWQREEV